MNKVQWMMLGIYVGLILVIYGLLGALVYVSLQTPEIVEKQVVATVLVEKSFEVIRTVEVEKIVKETVMVAPVIENEPVAPTQIPPTPTPTEVPCTNLASLLESSPDYVDAGRLKAGTIVRWYATIRNDGTCVWDHYWLKSIDRDPFAYEVPVVYPGETVRLTLIDMRVPKSDVSFKLVMFDDKGNSFPFLSGGWQGTLVWTMESYWEDDTGYGVKQICTTGG